MQSQNQLSPLAILELFKSQTVQEELEYILADEIRNLGFELISGDKLKKTKIENLSKELSLVKRHLAIDYGQFGLHLPDVDIVIYDPKNCTVIAVISSKVTLRECIAQTGYWKKKFLQDKGTEHIRVYFITPDEDGTLTQREPIKKGRAIVETDTDGGYVMMKVIK